MALTTSVEAAAGRVPITIVSLDGELDASNFERFVDEMGQLYAAGTRNLLLDLTNLTFLASSGLVGAQLDRADHARTAADRSGIRLGRAPRARQRSRRWDDPDRGPAGRSPAGRRARPPADGPRPAVPHPSRPGHRARSVLSGRSRADDRRTARRRPARIDPCAIRRRRRRIGRDRHLAGHRGPRRTRPRGCRRARQRRTRRSRCIARSTSADGRSAGSSGGARPTGRSSRRSWAASWPA